MLKFAFSGQNMSKTYQQFYEITPNLVYNYKNTCDFLQNCNKDRLLPFATIQKYMYLVYCPLTSGTIVVNDHILRKTLCSRDKRVMKFYRSENKMSIQEPVYEPVCDQKKKK